MHFCHFDRTATKWPSSGDTKGNLVFETNPRIVTRSFDSAVRSLPWAKPNGLEMTQASAVTNLNSYNILPHIFKKYHTFKTRKAPMILTIGAYNSWRWPTLAYKDYHRPEELSFWVRNGIRRFLFSIVTRKLVISDKSLIKSNIICRYVYEHGNSIVVSI